MRHEALRILYHEDEPTDVVKVRGMLREMLTSTGFVFMTQSSGLEIRKDIASFKPDLILFDYRLPGPSGLELLGQLQELPGSPPAIFLANSGSIEIAMTALRNGAYDYLVKDTLTASELARTVFRTIAQARSEEARAEAERNLAVSQAQWRQAVGLAKTGIIFLNSYGSITGCNSLAEQMLGWPGSQMKNRDFHDLVHRVPVPSKGTNPHVCALQDAIEDAEVEDPIAEELIRADGSVAKFNLDISPVIVDGEKCGFTVSVGTPGMQVVVPEPSHDAPLRREAENERTDIMNVFTHLLQTPMTPIIMQLASLRMKGSDNLSERQLASLEVIERNLNRIKNTFGTATVAVNLRRGVNRVHPEPINVTNLTKVSMERWAKIAVEREVVIGLEGEDIEGNVDPHAWDAIVTALVPFAIHRTSPKRPIDVKLSKDEQYITFEVSDVGPSMSVRQIVGMLDPFTESMAELPVGQQVDAAMKFYLARIYAELHGGSLKIENRAAKGLVMTAKIPVRIRNAPGPQQLANKASKLA